MMVMPALYKMKLIYRDNFSVSRQINNCVQLWGIDVHQALNFCAKFYTAVGVTGSPYIDS